MKSKRKSGQLHLNHKYSPRREKVAWEVPCVATGDIERLKEIFPQVFVEGKVDFEKLRTILGDSIDKNPDRFTFSWAGRRDAVQILQMPTRATLVPVKSESVDFDSTQNLFIEGDNLEVMKLLYKAYFGKVKVIYLDPPYNTGNDFVYQDSYADPLDAYLKLTGQKSTEGNILTSNLESSGRFHSAWLTMMYPRLFVARQLLADDGVIFVSIDDHEAPNLRLVMNEIFGEENLVDCIIWKKRYGGGAKEKYLVSLHEYVLFYAKDKNLLNPLFIPGSDENANRYYKGKDEKFKVRGPYRTHPLEAGKNMDTRKNLVYPIPAPDGSEILPRRQWLWSKERTMKALQNNELEFVRSKGGWTVNPKQYLRDEKGELRPSKVFSIIEDVYTQHGTNEIIDIFGNAQVFSYAKPSGLVKRLLQLTTSNDDGDIVLDIFAGSAATAQAVLDLNRETGGNRRFIMIQIQEPTPTDSQARKEGYESIADIGKERIRRIIAKMSGKKQSRLAGGQNEDLGFKVFKLAESNHKPWRGVGDRTPEKYAEEMRGQIDSLVSGWKEENIIYEIALKEGFGLNSRIELTKEYKENKIWRITDGDSSLSFLVCLDDAIDPSVVKRLDVSKETLFVCRESAIDDTVAANLALQCRLKTI